MKQVYRCMVIIHVKDKPGGGSMFLRADDERIAEDGALKIMKDTIKARGIKEEDVRIEIKVYKSSEEEVIAYRAKMNRGPSSHSMVN